MCSKSQIVSRPFFKQRRDLVQEQSQQQSANIPFMFFACREKVFLSLLERDKELNCSKVK